MKKLIKNYFGWLNESNRPKHLKSGMAVFTTMMAACLIQGIAFTPSTVVSFVATCIVAVSVDYKDKLWGGKFDWLDVLATVLIPLTITFVSLILKLILWTVRYS